MKKKCLEILQKRLAKKTNQTEFRIEKVIDHVSNGKVMIICLIAG